MPTLLVWSAGPGGGGGGTCGAARLAPPAGGAGGACGAAAAGCWAAGAGALGGRWPRGWRRRRRWWRRGERRLRPWLDLSDRHVPETERDARCVVRSGITIVDGPVDVRKWNCRPMKPSVMPAIMSFFGSCTSHICSPLTHSVMRGAEPIMRIRNEFQLPGFQTSAMRVGRAPWLMRSDSPSSAPLPALASSSTWYAAPSSVDRRKMPLLKPGLMSVST